MFTKALVCTITSPSAMALGVCLVLSAMRFSYSLPAKSRRRMTVWLA